MNRAALVRELRNAALTFQAQTLNRLLTEWRYPVLSASEASAAKPQPDLSRNSQVTPPGAPGQHERKMNMAKTQLESFEQAMLSGYGSCRMLCECGKTYYEPNGPWTWEAGEKQALAENPKAIAIDYCPSQIDLEGIQYVDACDCWHPRAKRVMAFIDSHAHKIVKYLNSEKQRKLAEANAMAEAAP